MSRCSFCGLEGEWKNKMPSSERESKGDVNVILCDECINLYASEEWEKLKNRLDNSEDFVGNTS